MAIMFNKEGKLERPKRKEEIIDDAIKELSRSYGTCHPALKGKAKNTFKK